jgi:hypothetical protein
MKHECEVRLPNGLTGKAELRIDLERLAQDLAWKAYYNTSKRTTLKNGAVVVDITNDGTRSRNEKGPLKKEAKGEGGTR